MQVISIMYDYYSIIAPHLLVDFSYKKSLNIFVKFPLSLGENTESESKSGSNSNVFIMLTDKSRRRSEEFFRAHILADVKQQWRSGLRLRSTIDGSVTDLPVIEGRGNEGESEGGGGGRGGEGEKRNRGDSEKVGEADLSTELNEKVTAAGAAFVDRSVKGGGDGPLLSKGMEEWFWHSKNICIDNDVLDCIRSLYLAEVACEAGTICEERRIRELERDKERRNFALKFRFSGVREDKVHVSTGEKSHVCNLNIVLADVNLIMFLIMRKTAKVLQIEMIMTARAR